MKVPEESGRREKRRADMQLKAVCLIGLQFTGK